MEEINKERQRHWKMLLYPEDPSHVEALKRLDEYSYQYVAMLHDEDVWEEGDPKFDPLKHVLGEKKKPHIHVVIRCKQARWNTAICKELGIKLNYLQPCKDFDRACMYLTHIEYPQKHQYESEKAFGTLTAHLEKLLLDDDEGTRVLEIVKKIDATPGRVRYRDVLVFACHNGLYGEFRRLGAGVKFLIDEHNEDEGNDAIARLQAARDELERQRHALKFAEHQEAAPFRRFVAEDQLIRSHGGTPTYEEINGI